MGPEMPRMHVVTAIVLVAAGAGCHHSTVQPLSESVVVRVTSTDSTTARGLEIRDR